MPEQSIMFQDNPCREGYADGDAMLHESVTWVTQGLHKGYTGEVSWWYGGSTTGCTRVARGLREGTAIVPQEQ